MSESPDFGMHFQRMELCRTVMVLQDKLQNKEWRKHKRNFTLLFKTLPLTRDITKGM